MLADEFRLPGSSYDELGKIIRSYAHSAPDALLPEVSRLAGVHPTIISRNNAFLVAMGIVTAGRSKTITAEGKSLAQALEHEEVLPEEVSRRWRALVLPNPFFQKLMAAVKIRRGMDESTLQAHVAYSAGQKKTQSVMAGAAAVVKIMRVSGLLQEDNGKLVVSDEPLAQQPAAESADDEAQHTAVVPKHAEPTGAMPSGTIYFAGHGAAPAVNVTIQLQIQCTPDQLDELGTKLRDLIERVAANRIGQ